MNDINTGSSQESSAPAPTATGANPAPAAPQTQFSDLAKNRAQHQGASQGVGAQPDSGQVTPGNQETQRSEYIPRDRFDEVNTRRIQAEAQLQQLQQQFTQAQMAAAARANSGYAPQQQPQQVPQVAQDFLASISSKEEQEKWRQKIINQPVTGIAELIQAAIQSEGGKLLNQINATLSPVQQHYLQQQEMAIQQYAQKRATSPEWGAISNTFAQLARTAMKQGYSINPQSLEVVESVARIQHGIPAYGSAPVQQAPFTERPGAGQNSYQQPAAVLSDEQRRYARMFGMSEQQYAANYAVLGGGAQ